MKARQISDKADSSLNVNRTQILRVEIYKTHNINPNFIKQIFALKERPIRA